MNKTFTKKLSTNKYFEFQLTHWGVGWLLSFELRLNWLFKQDHAGPLFEITIFGLFFSIKIYDNRHWDRKNNCWEVHNDWEVI